MARPRPTESREIWRHRALTSAELPGGRPPLVLEPQIPLPSWSWRQEGFLHPPRHRFSYPNERLFRVWGGGSAMQGRPTAAGVCFSPTAPRSRLEADQLFDIFEWSNAARYVTEFRLPEGMSLWIGRVDPASGPGWTWPSGDPVAALGEQVFIENPRAQKVMPLHTRRLADDMSSVFLGAERPPTPNVPRGRQ
jgi:hypothetical protein